MSAEHEETFLELLHRLARSISEDAGLTEAQATHLAQCITEHVREECGGQEVYVHMRERRSVRDQVLALFDGRNRDQVCEQLGISRRRFYQILAER